MISVIKAQSTERKVPPASPTRAVPTSCVIGAAGMVVIGLVPASRVEVLLTEMTGLRPSRSEMRAPGIVPMAVATMPGMVLDTDATASPTCG
jgi:hypothetical protein